MKFFAVLCVLLFSVVGFAQEAATLVMSPDLTQTVEVQDFLKFLVESLGGVKGASSLAIIALVVQAVLLLVRMKFADKVTKGYKLIIVYSLSMIGGILALMSQGVDLQTALFHANSLAAYQVLFHQAIKIYADKKDDTQKPS